MRYCKEEAAALIAEKRERERERVPAEEEVEGDARRTTAMAQAREWGRSNGGTTRARLYTVAAAKP